MTHFVSALQSLQSFFITKRLSAGPSSTQLYLGAPVVAPTVTADNQRVTNTTIEKFDGAAMAPVVMYVTETTALLRQPLKEFDGLILKLRYGDAVAVARFQGNYAQVQTGGTIGWVLKDALTKRKADVWPVWSVGQWYSIDHETTKQVRQLIDDQFFAAGAQLPLQSVEHVTAVLYEDKRSIPWPVTYGRLPGCWHQLLRGVMGVHISIHPTTDSVMEWTGEDATGRLVMVREVRPDNSLRVEGIGILEEGVFESVLLPESLWREWRPVFIEVG